VGRSGTGSLDVTSQGAINAIIVNVGRGTDAFGTLTVNNGSLNLSGQQTAGSLAGAAWQSACAAASAPRASPTAASSPSRTRAPRGPAYMSVVPAFPRRKRRAHGQQFADSTSRRRPARRRSASAHDGNGIATFTGSTLNVGNPIGAAADGSLVVAGQVGSTGTLAVTAGSVIKAGYVGVGATTEGRAVAATLRLGQQQHLHHDLRSRHERIADGNDGVINASGDVIVAGTISPGNSPGG
jgi:hypothetical protein